MIKRFLSFYVRNIVFKPLKIFLNTVSFPNLTREFHLRLLNFLMTIFTFITALDIITQVQT